MIKNLIPIRSTIRCRRSLVVLASVLLLAVMTDVAISCPTCSDAIAANDPAQAGLVRGYFWSILFMMSMPFLILASLSTYFYLLVRAARNEASKAVSIDRNLSVAGS